MVTKTWYIYKKKNKIEKLSLHKRVRFSQNGTNVFPSSLIPRTTLSISIRLLFFFFSQVSLLTFHFSSSFLPFFQFHLLSSQRLIHFLSCLASYFVLFFLYFDISNVARHVTTTNIPETRDFPPLFFIKKKENIVKSLFFENLAKN